MNESKLLIVQDGTKIKQNSGKDQVSFLLLFSVWCCKIAQPKKKTVRGKTKLQDEEEVLKLFGVCKLISDLGNEFRLPCGLCQGRTCCRVFILSACLPDSLIQNIVKVTNTFVLLQQSNGSGRASH